MTRTVMDRVKSLLDSIPDLINVVGMSEFVDPKYVNYVIELRRELDDYDMVPRSSS